MQKRDNMRNEPVHNIPTDISPNERYKITRNETSYDPNRNEQIEDTFGSDYRYILYNDYHKSYTITTYLKSVNPNHYTEYGFVKLMESAINQQNTNRLLSHLKDMQVSGYNDYAKSACITFVANKEEPVEMQKLIIAIKQLQSNNNIINMIGADTNGDNRIHLLRARSGPSKPHKYKIKGISKTLVDVTTKNISNARAVTDILRQQLGFDMEQTQWSRKLSNKSRKFTLDISVASTLPCPQFEDTQSKYEWNMVINGHQTNILLFIEIIGNKNEINDKISAKMNDVAIKEYYMNKISKNTISESTRKQFFFFFFF